MIWLICQNCGQGLSVPGSLAGGKENCPRCGRPVSVPFQREISRSIKLNHAGVMVAIGTVILIVCVWGSYDQWSAWQRFIAVWAIFVGGTMWTGILLVLGAIYKGQEK